MGNDNVHVHVAVLCSLSCVANISAVRPIEISICGTGGEANMLIEMEQESVFSQIVEDYCL